MFTIISVVWPQHLKVHPTTENDFLHCQSSWFFIWSTNKTVTKAKTSNVPATLDITRYAPSWKITKHKSAGGGGGAGTQAFFWQPCSSENKLPLPEKGEWLKIQTQKKTEQCNVCQSLNKYEKLLWFYVFQYCVFFIQRNQVCDTTIGR